MRLGTGSPHFLFYGGGDVARVHVNGTSQEPARMEKIKNCLVIALALAGASATACSSDEPSTEHSQPAASVGDEVTPQENAMDPQPAAASESQQMPDAPPVTAAPPTAVSAPAGVDEPVAESLRDAQIVKITDLVNTAEVEQAKLAKTKAQNPAVRKFATNMISQHTKAKQKGMQLTKASGLAQEESTEAGELEAKGTQTLESLKTVDKSSFDNAYMSAQVQQHQEVLDMLSTRLIPSATDPKLKAELEDTRTMVQRHLTEAQQIHQSLGSD